MKKLLKTGLVVPMLVLALAVTGFAVQAADAQNDRKDMNQDLNGEMNDSSKRSQPTSADRALDGSDLNDTGAVVNAEGVNNARRGSLDRRGRQSTKTNVALAADKDKWWSSSHNNDDEGGDEGGDEGDDEGDEGDDENGGETPTDPQP
jgi:hypothetical protein